MSESNSKLSKNSKVTLTLEQLANIVSDVVEERITKLIGPIMEKRVKKVLNEYIDNGLLGNSDVIQLKEQNALMDKYVQLKRELENVADKISIPAVQNQPMNITEGAFLNNSQKFESTKLKTHLASTARSMMNGGPGGNTLSLNTGNVNGAIPEGVPPQAVSEDPMKKNAINNKIQEIKQSARDAQQASYFDAMMEIEGAVDLAS